MTNREIALHLALLALLFLAGGALYFYQKSGAMVPVLIRYLDSDNFRERQAATARLQELGSAARAAAPRLLAFTADPHSRDKQAVSVALSRIDLTAGRAAMDAAQAALSSTDVNARRRAAETLGGLGLFARPAVPSLIAASRDPDALVRDRAVSALGRIGIPTAEILPVLITALDDPVYHVRYAAVVAMEQLPALSLAAALPALQRIARGQDQAVKSRAGYAANRIQTAYPLSIELSTSRYMLASGLESQLYTLHKLAALGPAAAPMAADLAALLDGPDDIVRYSAIEALGAMGPAAHSAAPALRAHLADREPVIRDAARHALALLGENP
jgi:HEAT repeat protein